MLIFRFHAVWEGDGGMDRYYSTLSKSEVFIRMECHTQKAFFIGNEGSKKLTLWRKNNYFELTWPAFVGQTSFCGIVKEENGEVLIIGKFLPNHYMWIHIVLSLIIIPIVAYGVTKSFIPACLTVLFVLIGSVVHFAAAPDIGKKGNEIVARFIEEKLCY